MITPPRRAVVCAWCEQVQSGGTYPASHTICPACLDKSINEQQTAADASVDSLWPFSKAVTIMGGILAIIFAGYALGLWLGA